MNHLGKFEVKDLETILKCKMQKKNLPLSSTLLQVPSCSGKIKWVPMKLDSDLYPNKNASVSTCFPFSKRFLALTWWNFLNTSFGILYILKTLPKSRIFGVLGENSIWGTLIKIEIFLLITVFPSFNTAR